MMATDQADYSLLDVREIVFEVDAPESDED
jgi:hypothetical protein